MSDPTEPGDQYPAGEESSGASGWPQPGSSSSQGQWPATPYGNQAAAGQRPGDQWPQASAMGATPPGPAQPGPQASPGVGNPYQAPAPGNPYQAPAPGNPYQAPGVGNQYQAPAPGNPYQGQPFPPQQPALSPGNPYQGAAAPTHYQGAASGNPNAWTQPAPGYQAPYQGQFAQPGPRKASAKVGVFVVVGLVVAALIAGAIWFTTRPDVTPVPSPSPSDTPPPVTETPANSDLPAAPGSGTVSGVIDHLKGLGYGCEAEPVEAILSYICLVRTGIAADAENTVYVAGHPSGALGRVSLSYVGDSNSATALDVRDYLLSEFLGNSSDVEQVIDELEAGSKTDFAYFAMAGMEFWGASNGSVIAAVEGWLPPELSRPELTADADQFTSHLEDLGYDCESDSGRHTCTRSSDGLDYSVRYRVRAGEVIWLTLWASAPGSLESNDSSASELSAEAASVFSTFEDGGANYLAALDSFGSSDGYTFVGSVMVDYYRDIEQNSAVETGIYLYPSCWSDELSWC